jgi:radical SAM PhpK family P-methyltransferase
MNSQEFSDYLGMVRGFGEAAGAYRDLNLSFIEYEGRPYQAMDLLSHLYVKNGGERHYPFHNADFIWPTITYLGTFLSRRGLTFDFVNAFQYDKDELREKLTSEEVLTVAIPTTLYVVPWPIQEIIDFVRECNPRVKIVVGGPYIANLAKSGDREVVESQLRSLGADIYVISSEGETALVELLRALKSGGDLANVANLAYRDGTRFVFTKPIVEQNSLAENMVDYSLFPREAMGQFVSTRTAKSCPFACSFCNFPQQAGQYTFMSVEMVERELNAIRDLGTVTTVTFIDDTFNVPKKRFHAILQMMIRNEYFRHFKWNCTFRCDHADDEIISLMGKAGCEGVFLGVESGSDRQLSAMNKTARRKDYAWAIPRLKEESILAHANVFIGFPGETLDSVEETVSLIRETRPETFSAQPWYANPLTPIWKKRDEYEIRGSSFQWSHKTMDATTACDLVDRIFLAVDDSIFLPQYGFFQWSLFYLQRQGMPLERIKRYLRAFNALVREKMIGRADELTHTQLIANLEDSARFDGELPPEHEALTLYSGEARAAAERYCLDVFGGVDAEAGSALGQSLEPHTEAFTRAEVAPIPVPAVLDADAVLAAYAVLLWGLDELRATLLIACVPEPVPLVLRPDADQTFESWVKTVREAAREAERHRPHASDILSGASTLFPFRNERPRFRAAFVIDGGDGPAPYTHVPQGADVLLEASLKLNGGPPALHIRGRCDVAVLERLAQLFHAVLSEAVRHPQARVRELAGAGAVACAANPLEHHRGEMFTF